MEATIRRTLTMAHQVLEFAQANPDTDPSAVALVTRLQDSITQADMLTQQQDSSTNDQHAAVTQRDALRFGVLNDQIRHLVHIAGDAMKDHPDLQSGFTPPPRRAPLLVFIAEAKTLLANAQAQKDLLLASGLGATFLDDFGAAITQFDTAMATSHAGRQGHVGARAQLAALSTGCGYLVRALDGLNQARFKDNAEQLAAWNSAMNVLGPSRGHHQEPAPAPVTTPTPAPSPVPVAGSEPAAGGTAVA